MSEESLKKKTVKGVAWTSMDQVTNIGFGFVIGVILARLLSPSDYGLLAMIGVFNAIAFTFLDSGFSNALIRKPDLTEDDNTTAFCFNLVAGVILFGIIWLIAPWVSKFYDKPILTPLLRAEGSLLIVCSFKIVQNTQLTRALNFKAKMIIRLASNVLGGIIGVISAYKGLGVWALVVMHISSSLIDLVLLWVISPWRPHGRWSNSSLAYLWGYGSKLLASGLLDTIYSNIYPIVIGKFYSAADLGQYSRAKQYAHMPSGTLTGVLQKVSFPVLSQIQEDNERLGSSYRRMLRFTVFIVFPIMMGMAALAYPLVITLVTDKWAQCVPYLQIICFSSMWYPVHAINLSLLQVKGRSDLFLKLEIVKKILITVVIFISVPFGIMGICYGSVFTSLACLAINTYYTGKLIHVGFFRQMTDMTPTLLNSLAMGAVVYFLTMPLASNVLKLVVGIPVGMVVYLAVAWLFRLPELKEAIDIIRRR
ncbi:MAG: lipopolysaccharide biosynthesis protein [Muribaculaceae bacterium]|nr:lipopolysaccharide biosynthesis protein [Muribaculaceae bacterium]